MNRITGYIKMVVCPTIVFLTLAATNASAQVGGPSPTSTSDSSASVLGIDPTSFTGTLPGATGHFVSSYITPVYCHEVEVTFLGVHVDAQSQGGGELKIGLYEGNNLVYETDPILINGGADALVGDVVPAGALALTNGVGYRIGLMYSGPGPVYIKSSSAPVYNGIVTFSSGLSFFDNTTSFPTLPALFSITGAYSENIAFQINGNVNTYNSTSSITAMACTSYTSPSGQHTWTSSGTYQDTLQNAAGCDSIITVDLAILSEANPPEEVQACQPYFWSATGQTYSVSGTYSTTLTGAYGCDSIVTLNLSVGTTTYGTDEVSTVGAYTWIDGNTYTSSNNTATYVTTNAMGCDSIVTLDLTIQNAGITDVDDVKVRAYPNPVTDHLTVVFDDAQARDYHFIDMSGRVVQSGSMEKETNVLEVSQLHAGVYMLSVSGVNRVIQILKH